MSNDNKVEFIDGLSVKEPRPGAPEFVKLVGSIKREAFIAWLQARDDEWINFDVKSAKSGKLYAAVDSWKPNQAPAQRQESRPAQQSAQADSGFVDDGFSDSDVPF